MRVRPIGFAGAHHCAAATQYGGCFACVEVTSMADLRSRPEARVTLDVQARIIGANAESAK
jgi:hypothetical protein